MPNTILQCPMQAPSQWNIDHVGYVRVKVHTHRPTFAESALEPVLELADSSPKSADSSDDTPMGM